MRPEEIKQEIGKLILSEKLLHRRCLGFYCPKQSK
jgi:hypothetical protein